MCLFYPYFPLQTAFPPSLLLLIIWYKTWQPGVPKCVYQHLSVSLFLPFTNFLEKDSTVPA